MLEIHIGDSDFMTAEMNPQENPKTDVVAKMVNRKVTRESSLTVTSSSITDKSPETNIVAEVVERKVTRKPSATVTSSSIIDDIPLLRVREKGQKRKPSRSASTELGNAPKRESKENETVIKAFKIPKASLSGSIKKRLGPPVPPSASTSTATRSEARLGSNESKYSAGGCLTTTASNLGSFSQRLGPLIPPYPGTSADPRCEARTGEGTRSLPAERRSSSTGTSSNASSQRKSRSVRRRELLQVGHEVQPQQGERSTSRGSRQDPNLEPVNGIDASMTYERARKWKCSYCASDDHEYSVDSMGKTPCQRRKDSACYYPLCNDEYPHNIRACLTLHQRCPLCHHRGHHGICQRGRGQRELRFIFEEYAEHGRCTRQRISRLDWGFYEIERRAVERINNDLNYERLVDLSIEDAQEELREFTRRFDAGNLPPMVKKRSRQGTKSTRNQRFVKQMILSRERKLKLQATRDATPAGEERYQREDETFYFCE